MRCYNHSQRDFKSSFLSFLPRIFPLTSEVLRLCALQELQQMGFPAGEGSAAKVVSAEKNTGYFFLSTPSYNNIPSCWSCAFTPTETITAGRWMSERLQWGSLVPVTNQSVTTCWHVPPPDPGEDFSQFFVFWGAPCHTISCSFGK